MLLCPWDFPGKSTGVDCHFLLQRIFSTQGSNPGLLHCRQTFYCLSHQGSLNMEKAPQVSAPHTSLLSLWIFCLLLQEGLRSRTSAPQHFLVWVLEREISRKPWGLVSLEPVLKANAMRIPVYKTNRGEVSLFKWGHMGPISLPVSLSCLGLDSVTLRAPQGLYMTNLGTSLYPSELFGCMW